MINTLKTCRDTISTLGGGRLWRLGQSAGVLAVLLSIASGAMAQTVTNLFTADGTFVVPPGVTSITVQAWGGGGRGGSRASSSGACGGGGGGAYSRSTLSSVPGTTNTVRVGVGSTDNATAGGDSWFSTNAVVAGARVLAKGGGTVANNTATGAAGGLAASGIGSVRYSGGNGAAGSGSNAGGGGSSAGTATNGTNATGSTGAVAPTGGGNGGAGRTGTNGVGNPGSAPGGAGGGAYRSTSGSTAGGNGANGQVVVVYVVQPKSISFSTPPRTIIEGSVSQPITVQLLDASGNLAQSIGSTVVNLSSVPAGTFRDAGDTTDITSVTIADSQTQATFLFRGITVGTNVLTAAHSGGVLTSATQNLVVRALSTQPPPVQVFYLPLPEAQVLQVLSSLNATAVNPVYRYAGIAVSSAGTLIYYDQMEDGYEATLHLPTSIYHPTSNPSGTQIWGDGNSANGVTPGFPTDIIPAGSAVILSNAVTTTDAPSPSAPKFRGGDRIGVTKASALSTTLWAAGTQTLLCDAVEVYDTFNWGTDYRVPVGTNVAINLQSNIFEYVGASIMAGRGGATVQIDADANGTYETSVTLTEGQAHLVNNGLRVGARISANNPVQVDIQTGDIGDNYESRWFRLLPTNLWVGSYFTPVSTPPLSFMSSAPAGGTLTSVWLYNPSTNTAINVTYDRRGGGSLTNNVACKGVAYASTNLLGSAYGNVYGQIVELNSDGTVGTSPEGAWIGIVDRSASNTPSIESKVANAQSAGAAAVIIVRNAGGTTYPTETAGTGRVIPVVGMTQNGGAALRAAGLGAGWVRVSGNEVSSTIAVPAGSVVRQVMDDGYAGHFYTAGGQPFYAVSTTDVTGALNQNKTWDWGFTLVPETSLTRQVLVGLGFGRDPTSATNPSENGSPIWVTTAGNGNTNVTVYVDYDSNPSTGALTDEYGSKYDLALTLRELELVKVYNPSGNQSGMMLYVLAKGVKLAAAWGQDPLQSSVAQPGFDAGTGIPPLPLFTATKKSTFVKDNDGDGFISPGDGLDYEIRIQNISRVPIDDMTLEDTLPAAVIYTTNTTWFVSHTSVTSSIPDHTHATKFPLDEGGIVLPSPSLPPGQVWVVKYSVLIKPFPEIPPGTITIVNAAIVNSLVVDDPIDLDTEEPLYGRVGDFVWRDLDGDGIQDGGELGLAGVTVRLYNGAGTLVGTKTTDANGFYEFTGLVGGNYRVEFVAPSGYLFSPQNADAAGLRGGSNSDPNPATGSTAVFTLEPGEPIAQIDAGLYQTVALGDRVWIDQNGNGLQTGGEPGLSGVTVNLLNAAGNPVLDGSNNPITTTTDANGNYAFTGLLPGSYRVQVVLPATYVFTTPNADSQGLDGPNNSDVSAGTGITSVITLTSGQVNNNIDAGLALRPAAIGDRVWLDEDGDGLQDAGEDGIANAKVELVNDANVVVATTYTDADGNYLFTGVGPGTYTVRVVPASLPAGLAANQTYDEDGTGTAHQSAVTVVPGDLYLTADFGYNWAPPGDTDGGTGTGAIGDRVWIDADGDGVQDPGEAGLGGVTVTLYHDPDGNGVYDTPYTLGGYTPTRTTGADGLYIFDALPAGAYAVGVTAPGGYTQTGDPDFFGETLPAGERDNRTTTPIVLAPGDVFVNADFGYQPAAGTAGSIGDRVWLDADADGTQGAGEPGIPGVSVALVKDANGNGVWDAGELIVATTVTGTNGVYSFTGLPTTDGAGTDDYLVWVSDTAGLLAGFTPTDDFDDTAPASGLKSGYGVSAVADLAPDGTLLHDFGYTAPGQTVGKGLIGDTVWLDRDGNGAQGPTESGLQGVTVDLFAADGTTLLRTTITDANGNYYFGGLADATYVVKVGTASLPNGGVGLTNTGDPDGGANSQSTVVISGGNRINLLQDFGYQATVPNTIGGTVWEDRNADGTLTDGTGGTPNETGNGVAGVTVVLRDADGHVTGTTVTDANGNYLFTGLPDGTYTVDVTDDANRLAGWWHSTGPTPGSDNNSQSDPYGVTVAGGQTDMTGDFGYYVDPAAIGNYVWNDADNDGVQDGGEAGIPGAVVTLTITYPDSTVVTMATVTDANGLYRFGNLLLDEDHDGVNTGEPVYSVSVETPAGWIRGRSDVGGDDAVDSDNHAGVAATVVQGELDDTYDFNFLWPDAIIGDRVWLDEDGDGIQDAGEDGIANVKVELLGPGGVVLATTTTDQNGGYLFHYQAGTYTVRVDNTTLPAGLAANPTYDEDGTGTAHQSAVTVGPGDVHLTSDFGYNWTPPGDTDNGTGTGAIGDRVWVDADGDGAQDPGEPGLGGVTVRLFRDGAATGNYTTLVATTTTDAAGNYIFDGLAPGAYQVVVNGGTTPAGYTQTGDPDYFGQTLVAGQADNRTTTPIVLAPGDVFVNADFGYQPAAGTAGSLGDRVWLDADADGTQDPGEAGIPGVSVALVRDSNGNGVWDAGEPIIATTATGADGLYQFSGLPATDGAGTDDYLVWVNDTAGLLAGLTPTYDLDGAAPANGVVSGYGVSAATDLTPAGTDLHDYGYTAGGQTAGKGLIGDTVWLDRDGNGAQGAGEPGLDGVTVRLYAADGTTLLATTATDANGNYWFGNLSDATYVVKVGTATLPNGGVGLTNTGDPDTASPGDSQSTVAISGGNVNLLQDFGYQAAVPNTIGGTVWEDRNADGTLTDGTGGTANEAGNGVPGVTVVLRDASGNVVGTTVTDAAGAYSFTGLPDGTYSVDVTDAANKLAGWWHSDGPSDGTDNNSQPDPYTVSVAGGQTNTTGDFGYFVRPGALGNRVWWDVDGNGRQDTGESGLANSVLRLRIAYANGVTNTVTTRSDASGYYSFGNLLLDEDQNGGVGTPQFVLSVQPRTSFNHTVRDASGVPASLNSDAPLGVLAFAQKGLDRIASNSANPSLEDAAGWYDFGFTQVPTSASISAVRSRVANGVAFISWDVEIEVGAIGYHLDRWVDGEWVRINPALIDADGFGGGGVTYEQADPGAPLGTTQQYRIVNVSNLGFATPYGPYTLALDGGAVSFDTWAVVIGWAGAPSGRDDDADGDGLTNFGEYLAGTDPLNRNSVLRLNGLAPTPQGLVLRWSSVAGRTYALEAAGSVGGPYHAIQTGIVAAPPENTLVLPVNPATTPSVFFRVVVTQP